jgi:hypothetical protein
MRKLFVSYSRNDSEFVRRLAHDLRAAGIAIWLDQEDIAPGERWDDAIERALKNATETLVVISRHSAVSQTVLDEISYSLDSNKRVIPVLWERCEIPFRLRRLQNIDFTEHYANGVKRLITALEEPAKTAFEALSVGARVEAESGEDLQGGGSDQATDSPDKRAGPRRSSMGAAAVDLVDVEAYTTILTEAVIKASVSTPLFGSVGKADFAVAWLPRLFEGYQYKTGLRPRISEVILKRLADDNIARLVTAGLLDPRFAEALNANIERLQVALADHQVALKVRHWMAPGIPPFHGWLFGDTLLRNAWARGSGGFFHVMTPLVLYEKKATTDEIFETTYAHFGTGA